MPHAADAEHAGLGLGGLVRRAPGVVDQAPAPQGIYSEYGYAGYSYTTYDLDSGCASTLIDPDYKFETTVANGEFMIATAVIGASNALRERAWDPQTLWGWADPLVDQATKAVYEKVFSVFGVITLADRRPLPALALPAGRHGRGDDDRRLGDPRHGRGDRDRGVAGPVGQPRRPDA